MLILIKGSNELFTALAVQTNGFFCQEDGRQYLEYEEYDAQGESVCTSQIHFSEDTVSIESADSQKLVLQLSKGRVSETCKNLSPMDKQFSIFPFVIDYDVSPEKGYLNLRYQVNSGDTSAINGITVKYKSI